MERILEEISCADRRVHVQCRARGKVHDRNNLQKNIDGSCSGMVVQPDGDSHTEMRFAGRFQSSSDPVVERETSAFHMDQLERVDQKIPVHLHGISSSERPRDRTVNGRAFAQPELSGNTGRLPHDHAETESATLRIQLRATAEQTPQEPQDERGRSRAPNGNPRKGRPLRISGRPIYIVFRTAGRHPKRAVQWQKPPIPPLPKEAHSRRYLPVCRPAFASGPPRSRSRISSRPRGHRRFGS